MAGKRYFEFVDGSSNKFWEVWLEGSQVFTRYGKIGSNGQITVKDEGSDEKGQKLYDKLVREKTGKGYQEKTAGGGAAPAAKAAAPAAKKNAPPPADDDDEEDEKPAKKSAAAAPAPAAAGGTRRFEFTEDGSSKFWEITVDGNAHTVRYGKIGTPGQEKSKSFGNAAGAQADADKLVREKTGKGYQEVAGAGGGGGGGPPAPPLDPKELKAQLAAIDKESASPEACQVFADWLESKGHPWGKLIALHHAIATAPNAKKKAELEKEETTLLQSQGAAILGDLARAGRPTRFEWSYGFLTHATISSPTDKVVLKERLGTLFSLPAARSLRRLTLHAQPARINSHQEQEDSTEDVVDPWVDMVGVLAEAPASLSEVAFGEAPPSGASAYVAIPNLTQLSKALPKLKVLELQGAGGSADSGLEGKLAMPDLTSLEVRLAAPNEEDLQAIASAKMPKLESLSVWLGGQAYTDLDSAGYDPYDNEDGDASYPETYPASDLEKMEIYDVNPAVNAAAVGTFLKGPFPATLKRLGLNSAMFNAELLEAIIHAPVTKQLEVLDLSGGTLRDSEVAVFTKNKSKLAHLKELNVARNRLTKAGLDELQKAVPTTKAGKQRDSGEPEFFFRYVATME